MLIKMPSKLYSAKSHYQLNRLSLLVKDPEISRAVEIARARALNTVWIPMMLWALGQLCFNVYVQYEENTFYNKLFTYQAIIAIVMCVFWGVLSKIRQADRWFLTLVVWVPYFTLCVIVM